ncbi:MAG: MFS transporter [Holophagaceae bacterium]|nr:MFS transporter [Holophagaceae bacterium]
MVETIKQSLRESKSWRWITLCLVSITMLWAYFFEKVVSAIKPALESHQGWTSTQFGIFRFSYMWLTVFAGMLVVGGIILDKKGIRFTGVMATIVMLAGAFLCYLAVSAGFEVSTQVWVASAGFAMFCCGDEVAGITVSKVIIKWFKGKSLALAMGLQVAIARMGTGLALLVGLPLVTFGVTHPSVGRPIFAGMILLAVGMMAFIVYTGVDKKLDASEPTAAVATEDSPKKDEDAFKISDIFVILKNQGFWLIAVLCVLFYSAVFPYLDFATELMLNKYGFSEKWAGVIPSLLPFGTILLTPVFGTIYDRKGKGATIMAIGAVLLIIVHIIFSIPALVHWGWALFAVLLLGVSFSLVPSAMWPSVPKLIPEKQLGTAYSMIFFIQNIGLGLVPLLIGWVLDKYCITEAFRLGIDGPKYDYTIPMVIFTVFGILALIVAMMLKATDGKKGYGLELPNIK